MSTIKTFHAVKLALSSARMATFETASVSVGIESFEALELYAWNARVSAALLAPLHICEVVIRNSVADALDSVYGPKWPWSAAFERSLPNPRIGYSPRQDLQASRRTSLTTGKAIPELKFVFWQKMFTERHDARLWDRHLSLVLPNVDTRKSVAQSRRKIYEDLEQIRSLRNRIAHHEPIFRRSLSDDMGKIVTLVELRCSITALWMMQNQEASRLLLERGYI